MTQQPDWKTEREAIRARLNAATPGTWHIREAAKFGQNTIIDTRTEGGLLGAVAQTINFAAAMSFETGQKECDKQSQRDADFIAHAPDDLRTLLAHAEEDERKIERLRLATFANQQAHNLADAELALRDQRISELEEQAVRMAGEVRAAQRAEDFARSDLTMLKRERVGEVWIWSTGDPEDGDNADTITCPILIESEAFRLILAELAAARESCGRGEI